MLICKYDLKYYGLRLQQNPGFMSTFSTLENSLKLIMQFFYFQMERRKQ